MDQFLDLYNKKYLIIIFIWVGAWGLIETIITKFISPDNLNTRILLYFILLIVALIFFNYYNSLELKLFESKIKNATITLK